MGQKLVIALAGAVVGAMAILLLDASPEVQAKREVDRCTQIARLMMARMQERPPESFTNLDVHGYAMACLLGRR